MTEPSSTRQTLDRLDRTLVAIAEPDRRALAVQLDRIRTTVAAVQAGSLVPGADDADVGDRFRMARRQVALQGQISDLIAEVNLLINDPAVGSDARVARDLLRTLTVA
jgi:hypothetical protein